MIEIEKYNQTEPSLAPTIVHPMSTANSTSEGFAPDKPQVPHVCISRENNDQILSDIIQDKSNDAFAPNKIYQIYVCDGDINPNNCQGPSDISESSTNLFDWWIVISMPEDLEGTGGR